MRGKSITTGLILILGTVLSQAPAKAELVTIYITAEIDGVSDPYDFFGGAIKVGDVITGAYTYDTSTADSSQSPKIGNYWHNLPPAGTSLSVGGIEFKTDPTNVKFFIGIVNDYPPRDNYGFISDRNIPLANGVVVDSIYWILEDRTGSAISTDVLVTSVPVLDDWSFNRLLISGPDRGQSFGITSHVTSAVPEPATIVLLAAGAVLASRRKPNNRKSGSRT